MKCDSHKTTKFAPDSHYTNKRLKVVFPLGPYIAQNGPALWKIGSTDFVKKCKKDAFLVNEPIFSLEDIILVQELPQFCKIL